MGLSIRAYARHRTAFGTPIADFPLVARILARLQTEAHAARASTFWIADMADRAATGRDIKTVDELSAAASLA